MQSQHELQLHHQLRAAILSLVAILMTGTIGYALMEHWSLLDSAYMTVIAISTVGFSEVHLLSPPARMFTIPLIFMGVANISFLLNRFTDAIIHGYFLKDMDFQRQRRLISTLNHHYIVCGLGQTGTQVALEFAAENIPFVAIDRCETVVTEALHLQYLAISGDATLDQTLVAAGIERCAGLVATLPSDADNLYILLSAKTLNPHIRTIVRANSPEASQKLQRAGADAVISPHLTGAKRMATAALRPQVLNFLDRIVSGNDRSLSLEQIPVKIKSDTSPQLILTIAQIRDQSGGAWIMAIHQKDGSLITTPPEDFPIQQGDILICLGTPEQLENLKIKILF